MPLMPRQLRKETVNYFYRQALILLVSIGNAVARNLTESKRVQNREQDSKTYNRVTNENSQYKLASVQRQVRP